MVSRDQTVRERFAEFGVRRVAAKKRRRLMNLYEVAVIVRARSDVDEKDSLSIAPTPVLAANEHTAAAKVLKAEGIELDMDRVEVLVRPF